MKGRLTSVFVLETIQGIRESELAPYQIISHRNATEDSLYSLVTMVVFIYVHHVTRNVQSHVVVGAGSGCVTVSEKVFGLTKMQML